MTDLPFRSATQLAQAIRDKEISSLELTDLYIERIEQYDQAINAVVVRCFDQARTAARAADETLARDRPLRWSRLYLRSKASGGVLVADRIVCLEIVGMTLSLIESSCDLCESSH